VLVVPLIGNGNLQEVIRTYFRVVPPVIHLYVNDYIPDLNSSGISFVEATYPGYLSQFTSWPNPPPSPDFPYLYFRGAPNTFRPSGVLTTRTRIYGYYVTDFISTNVLWAERFPIRIFFQDTRDSLVIIPKFGSLSEFSG